MGEAGLFLAILVLLLSKSISMITALSLSSISTNINVGKGGIYYIVSRSLGLDIGGAIGIPLYFSQAISVAFYIAGFVESLKWVIPQVNTLYVSIAVLVVFSFIAYIGADFAVKIQTFIFIALLISILSFLVSPHWVPLKSNLVPHYTEGINFWAVFAIFFPAVTGITAGVGMSGELKHPEKSIPRGTMLSIGFTMIVYLLVIFKFSALRDYSYLIGEPMLIYKSSIIPALIMVGIWAATLSSTLTFIMTAPRTLQALSDDRVVPRFLSFTLGSKLNEPRMGIIITFIIAGIFLLQGTLNTIATTITMFFLITYGVTNLASGLEGLIKNPSYRPSFRIPWWVSFIGVVAIFFVMSLINMVATIVSFSLIVLLYLFLKKRALTQTWGDLRNGIWLSLIRFSLFKINSKEIYSTNWRPNVMVFTGNPKTRLYLTKFAAWLGRGNGIITLFNLIKGEIKEQIKEREKNWYSLKQFVEREKLNVFFEVEIVKEPLKEIETIVQAHGLGGLASNLALFGWPFDGENREKFVEMIRNILMLRKNVLILKYNKEVGFGMKRSIDIWWRGRGKNEGLMLMIAYIISINPEWQNTSVRVLKIGSSPREKEELKSLIKKLHMSAEIKIIEDEKSSPFEVLSRESKNSDLIIMGMPFFKKGLEKSLIERLRQATFLNRTMLLVRSADITDLLSGS